ncbi:endoglucanase [Prevotella sp. CAG:891]|nr:endoglucanase [Prevotella sp. CAG:891]
MTLAKAEGTTDPVVNADKNDARVYAKGTVNVVTTGENMTQVVFAVSAKGKFQLAKITANVGEVVVNADAQTVTWTGAAKDVTFTVGEKADFGTKPTKAGQLCFDNITVVAGGTVTPSPEPNPDPQPQPDEKATIFSELFNVGQGDFTIDNKVMNDPLTYVWSFDEKRSLIKASAFVGGQKLAAESWLVSPVIDLTQAKETELSFNEAGNFFGGLDNFKAACTLKVKEEGGEWTDLAYNVAADGQSWTSGIATANLAAYDGKKIQLAFAYTSNTEFAGTWQIKELYVKAKTDKAPVVIEAPVFTPKQGTYMDKVSVSIAAAEGLKVYYTLDGSEPTTASTLYEAAFDLTETTTVMAIAVDAEGNASPVAKAMYTIKATPVAPENGALFNFNENKWNLPVSSSEETFPITEVKEGDVTLTFTNGSTPTRLWNDFNNGLQIRMYKEGGSMTVTPAADQKVVKVEFDATKLDVTASEGKLAEKVWTGEAATVTFTANATSNINYIIVTLSKQSGIEGVEAGEQTEKVIYTIDGRRVQKAEKGVYVINGKKVVVK